MLLDLMLPKSYVRFNIPESTRSPWSSNDANRLQLPQAAFYPFEGAHLAVQLLEQRFRGISFGKLLVGRQQFLKNLQSS